MSPRFWRPSSSGAPANNPTAMSALLRRSSAGTRWHKFGTAEKGGLLVLFTVLALCLCTCATLGYQKWRDSRRRRQSIDKEQADALAWDALAWVREQNQRAADNFEPAPAAPLDYSQRYLEPNRRPSPLRVLRCPRPRKTSGLRQLLHRYDSCSSGSGSKAPEDTPPGNLTGLDPEAAAFEYFEAARSAEQTPASFASTLFDQLLFETQQPLSTQPSSTESLLRQAAAWLQDQCLDNAAISSHGSPHARSNGPVATNASHHSHTSPKRDLATRRARCLDWENTATTDFGAWYTAQQAAGNAKEDPEFDAWWTAHQAACNAQPDTPRPAQFEDPTSNCSGLSCGASAGGSELRGRPDRWATRRDKQAFLEKLEYLEERRANDTSLGTKARVAAWSDGLSDGSLDPDTPPEPRTASSSPRFNAFGELLSLSPELPPAADNDNRNDDLVLEPPPPSPKLEELAEELADDHGPVLHPGLLQALAPLLEQDPAVAHAVGHLLLHDTTFEVVDDEDDGDDDPTASRSLHWSGFDGTHRDPYDDDYCDTG